MPLQWYVMPVVWSAISALPLQVTDLSERVVLSVNLADETEKKGITVDIARLENLLGIPVVQLSARENKGIDTLLHRLHEVLIGTPSHDRSHPDYGEAIRNAVQALIPQLEEMDYPFPTQWAALHIIEQDKSFCG